MAFHPEDPTVFVPPVSEIVNDPAKVVERTLEAELRELDILTNTPLGVPVPGTGPDASVGIDAEWTLDQSGTSNRILSIQIHLVGECGEFSHIEYVEDGIDNRPEFGKLITKVIVLAMEAGVVLEWPRRVIVAAFFLRADLTAFSDLARFKTRLESVGRSVGTTGDGIPFEVNFEPDDIERLTRSRLCVGTDGARSRVLQVKFVDLVRHVPVGTNLAEIGVLLGQPKIELPPGAIEQMDVLLAEQPELYARYAAQDALIAAYFLHRVSGVVDNLLEGVK